MEGQLEHRPSLTVLLSHVCLQLRSGIMSKKSVDSTPSLKALGFFRVSLKKKSTNHAPTNTVFLHKVTSIDTRLIVRIEFNQNIAFRNAGE